MITVFYSCHACGLVKVSCEVIARTTEPIGLWMETMGYALQADHHWRSPDCHARTAQDVMIPITSADKIGGEAIQ